ncbi:toxic anion resistance protein [Arsenicicoccus sp. oral taxon 190]|uniref:toxic anion resistance protein n=1 Tax=Arsenicicoccus sp. oral taxon 190 TaxID=1658671 RepID=UPI00067D7A7B|nr:toxic anion resistance protein [Arsenicicoccus sp. oral taxon 190]
MSSLDLTPLTPPEGEGAATAGRMPPATASQSATSQPAAAQAPAGPAVDPATAEALRRNAGAFVRDVLALDPHSPALDARVRDITTMGDAEVAASAQLSRRMLDRQARAASVGRRQGGPEQAASEQLVQLRREVEALDPADLDKPARKLLGLVPMGDRVADYFERYYASQDRINLLILALRTDQDELRKDNAAIAGEKANLWRLMGQLQEYSLLAGAIDDQLERALAQVAAPEQVAALRDRVQRAARQKHQDLLTHIAVCTQGYLALDIVRSNNELLVAGIDRAASTTLAALRTAVVVSDALRGQRLVLDRIQGMDRSSTGMLEDAAGRVAGTAGSGEAGGIGRLKQAFGEVYAALDDTAAAHQRGAEAEEAARRSLGQAPPLG